MDLKDFSILVGIVIGISGFILSLTNYLRDRPKVNLSLQWDLNVTPGGDLDSNRKWGILNITNIGRRPVFVSHASLKLPKGSNESYLLFTKNIAGQKLSEGDPPIKIPIDYVKLNQYSKNWYEIQAQVTDSTGKEWLSKKIGKKVVPSWVLKETEFHI
jgi:hypothetical protein